MNPVEIWGVDIPQRGISMSLQEKLFAENLVLIDTRSSGNESIAATDNKILQNITCGDQVCLSMVELLLYSMVVVLCRNH